MNIKVVVFGVMVSIACVHCVSKKPAEAESKIETAATLSGELYKLDTVNSVIEWIGSAPGDYKHNGIVKFSQGSVSVDADALTSVDLTVSMNSITSVDQSGEDKMHLEDHLKNKDFFEVEQFPVGRFQLVRASRVNDSLGYSLQVEGNLTLKNITRPVSFRATSKKDERGFTAESVPFNINRTHWDIVYHSGVIGTVKDKLINDNITLKVKLVAIKSNS